MLDLMLPPLLDASKGEAFRFAHFARPDFPMPISLVQFGMHTTAPCYGYGPATRDHELIHFVFEGMGDVTVAGRRFEVRSGEMFYIGKDTVSYYQADDEHPWLYAWIGFEGPWADEMLREIGLDGSTPVATIPDPEKMRALCLEMREKAFTPGGYIALCGLCMEMLHMLLGVEPRFPSRGIFPDMNRQQADEWINRTITFIEENFQKDISISELASDMGMSRGYLTERFKRCTGRTIKSYIVELRLQYAMVLMMRTKRSIKDIALECGYADPLFFSRMFKKRYGLSPLMYRRQAR